MSLAQWALITGASSGIGTDLARGLAAKGINLVLAARRQESLTALGDELAVQYKVDCRIEAIDLAEKDSAADLADRVNQLPIRILVNCAGFGFFGPFQKPDWTFYADMAQVNMVSMAQLTYLLLPAMRACKEDCYILNVGSVAGWQGVPQFAHYSATKAFVNTFSEGLAWELEGSNISVTCLQPGKTATGFFKSSGIEEGHDAYLRQGVMSAKDVAQAGLDAMFKRKAAVVTGLNNRLNVLASRMVPRHVLKHTISFLFKEFKE